MPALLAAPSQRLGSSSGGAELPRAPYGVQAMPAYMGNRAEYHNGPALDGSRAGFFFANTLVWRSRPKWGMETLVAHEAVPGHHTQAARASELRDQGALPLATLERVVDEWIADQLKS